MHELPHVHLPARKVPRSPNMSTSPLSTNSVVPLYDGSSHAPAGMDALPSHTRCLFPEGDHYQMCTPRPGIEGKCFKRSGARWWHNSRTAFSGTWFGKCAF